MLRAEIFYKALHPRQAFSLVEGLGADDDRHRRSSDEDHDCSRDNDKDDDDDDDDEGISSGAVVGIVIGCVVFIIILALCIIVARRNYVKGKNKSGRVARSTPNVYEIPLSSMPTSNLSAPTQPQQALPPMHFESNQWTMPHPPPYPGHELGNFTGNPAPTDVATGVESKKQGPPPPYPAHEVSKRVEVTAPPLESETPVYDEITTK